MTQFRKQGMETNEKEQDKDKDRYAQLQGSQYTCGELLDTIWHLKSASSCQPLRSPETNKMYLQ